MEKQITILQSRIDGMEQKIDTFQKTVQQLILHATMNAEAIVEHIAQLDSEKEEILQEYRSELSKIVQELKK